MKTVIEDDRIIVFLNKKETNNLQFNNEEKLENYFKNLFIKLNKNYNIELNGYYNIDIYRDINYGTIIEMKYEETDYYSYFNQVDMKINISNINTFLYEIKYNFLDNIIKNIICYKHLDKIYLQIKEEINDIEYSKILEYSKIIYGNSVNKIISYSEKVSI